MEEDMNKSFLLIMAIVLALVASFVVGAAAAGGIVYTWLHRAQPAYAAQNSESDPDMGLIVTSVEEDGPAAKAGIVRGDILQMIDNREVNRMADVREILKVLEAGDEVQLTVLHGDELRSLDVTIADGSSGVKLGISLCCGQITPVAIEIGESGSGKPLILHVQKESPAEKAGLEAGDMILSIDGNEINAEKSLSEWISQYKPGDQVQLEVRNLREEETRIVLVTLGESPDDESKAYLGVQVIQAPQGLENFGEDHPFFELPPLGEGGIPFRFYDRDRSNSPFSGGNFETGVIVMEVVENSPASIAGLQVGDVITALDGEDIQGSQSFVDSIIAMQPGEKVSLTVYRPSSDETLQLQATLGEHPDDPDAGYLGVQIRGTLRFGPFNEQIPFEDQLPFMDHLPFQLEGSL
jgi:S1-C subfamily serine protease